MGRRQRALCGSLLGGAVGAYIGWRRAGIQFWFFAEVLAPAMLVAQSLGRFGNYSNHELFGLPTTRPWGLEILPTNTMCTKDLYRRGPYFIRYFCKRSAGT